jgi:hypothetical protein
MTRGQSRGRSWVQGKRISLKHVCIHHERLQGVVRFEVFTKVTMKNSVFWDVTPCCSCKKRHFGGMYRLHLQEEKHQRARNNVSSS